MCGLMALPSSSTAAGAVPALRAASRSFCRLNSSRESFPVARRMLTACDMHPSNSSIPEADAITPCTQTRRGSGGGTDQRWWWDADSRRHNVTQSRRPRAGDLGPLSVDGKTLPACHLASARRGNWRGNCFGVLGGWRMLASGERLRNW